MMFQREGGEWVDVLIVTAVKEEWDAVIAVDTGATPGSSWQPRPGETGPEVFYRDFAIEGGALRIGVVQSFEKGREQAVIAAASVLGRHPEIRCLAMCGVCAGRRGDVVLGDVIIADRAWPYDAGKVRATVDEDGHRTEHFQGDVDLYRIQPPEWRNRAQRFQIDPTVPWIQERPRSYEAQGDWLLERLARNEDPWLHADRDRRCPDWAAVLERLWRAKRLENKRLMLTQAGRNHIDAQLTLAPGGLLEPAPFKVVVGPIASGAPVVEDPTIFESLSDTQGMRNVIGLEMETSAILALAYESKIPYAVVMKGVMDHADVFKSDNMKPFAAKASAECLIMFLRQNLTLVMLPPVRAEVVIKSPPNHAKVSHRPIVVGRAQPAGVEVWLVVHPLSGSDFWVQPPITVQSTGDWIGQPHVGRAALDHGQLFELRAVANPKNRLSEADILAGWPDAEMLSDVVIVERA